MNAANTLLKQDLHSTLHRWQI